MGKTKKEYKEGQDKAKSFLDYIPIFGGAGRVIDDRNKRLEDEIAKIDGNTDADDFRKHGKKIKVN